MILTERHIIKPSDRRYKELDNLCFLSKNLYNATLYAVRQHYFKTHEYLNYYCMDKLFKEQNNVDYRALPTKSSQQTMKIVDKNFKSFYQLLKKKKAGKYKKNIHIPKYLDKTKGRFPVIYTSIALSKNFLTKHIIKLEKSDLKFKTCVEDTSLIKQVRIVPKTDFIVMEVLYKVNEQALQKDNGRYCGIDIGVNNLATVSSNVERPFIINGRPLKSINQYFNKKKGYYQSILKKRNGKNTSNRLRSLTDKRNNKVNDYMHKASRMLTNQLADRSITTVVIGRNKDWKQDANIGKRNNQNFVQIPFYKFIQQIEYKCRLKGIKVVETEESYTSKCSFLDDEKIGKHEVYKGKRIKRGLFRSSSGQLINADVNGSLNILKKVAGNSIKKLNSVEACSTPAVFTIKLN